MNLINQSYNRKELLLQKLVKELAEKFYLKVMKHIKDEINLKERLIRIWVGSGNLIKNIYNSDFKGNFCAVNLGFSVKSY
jgi:hypothetical protein